MKAFFSNFGTNLTWNYSESGQGKGAPDWVGGTLKRTADQLKTKSKNLATSLLNALKEKTNIKKFYVEDEDIKSIKKLTPVKKLKVFVGTMRCHRVT